MTSINVGCGNSKLGDVRVDVVKTDTTTHVCDLNNPFPFKSEEFDVIYCNQVLEHIMNLKIFIDECYRILKPKGVMYFRTDHAGYFFFHTNLTGERNHNWKPNNKIDGHYHLFKKEHLERLFQDWKGVNINYVYGGRNKFRTFILKCFPYKMGATALKGEAWKGEKINKRALICKGYG